jgi:hypothetical protein
MELKTQIQTAAFLAYIMHRDGLDQAAALRRMAELCARTQVALGLGNVKLTDLSDSKGAL